MTQMKFFNTIRIRGHELERAQFTAKKQSDRIYEVFKRTSGKLTPFEIWQVDCELDQVVPITSIRRAMTTLTDDGKLIKTDRMKEERYGKANHYWRLATKAEMAWFLGEDTDMFHDPEKKAFDDLATFNERFTDY